MRLKIIIFPVLETVFEVLAEFFEHMRESVAICTHCGNNRYKGKACVKFSD